MAEIDRIMDGLRLKRIRHIIENCEAIQDEHGLSDYQRECAKLVAYEEIKEVLR